MVRNNLHPVYQEKNNLNKRNAVDNHQECIKN